MCQKSFSPHASKVAKAMKSESRFLAEMSFLFNFGGFVGIFQETLRMMGKKNYQTFFSYLAGIKGIFWGNFGKYRWHG